MPRLAALLALLATCLLFSPSLPARERPPHEEAIGDKRSFPLLGGPDRRGPEAQWERIQRLVAANRVRAARRQCAYLVDVWPDHPLAAQAQRLRADLYFASGRYKDAFDAYQGLIDRFSGNIDFPAVIAQQLECAERLEHKRYSAFFGLSDYTDPMVAVPLYRQLLTNAPRMDLSPDILFRIGDIQYRTKKYSEAITDFDLLEQRYPRSPFAEKAALRRADAFERIARMHPTDLGPQESALAALDHFLITYPNSTQREDVLARRRAAYERIAQQRYEQARFYETRANNPRAALTAYRALVAQFPDSEWTARAQERILHLNEHAN